MHVCVPHTTVFRGSATRTVGSVPHLLSRIKFFRSRPLSVQLTGDLCLKGFCLEANHSRMDYKPAQTTEDYMMWVRFWNHPRTGIKPPWGCQHALWWKQNKGLGPQWDVQGIPAFRALSDIAQTKQRKSLWTTLPLTKRITRAPEEYLLFFCLILGSKTMCHLAQNGKGDCINGLEILPCPLECRNL